MNNQPLNLKPERIAAEMAERADALERRSNAIRGYLQAIKTEDHKAPNKWLQIILEEALADRESYFLSTGMMFESGNAAGDHLDTAAKIHPLLEMCGKDGLESIVSYAQQLLDCRFPKQA